MTTAKRFATKNLWGLTEKFRASGVSEGDLSKAPTVRHLPPTWEFRC